MLPVFKEQVQVAPQLLSQAQEHCKLHVEQCSPCCAEPNKGRWIEETGCSVHLQEWQLGAYLLLFVFLVK